MNNIDSPVYIDLNKYLDFLASATDKYGEVNELKKCLSDQGIGGRVGIYQGPRANDGEVSFGERSDVSALRFSASGSIYKGPEVLNQVCSAPTSVARLFVGGLFGSDVNDSKAPSYQALFNVKDCWISGASAFCETTLPAAATVIRNEELSKDAEKKRERFADIITWSLSSEECPGAMEMLELNYIMDRHNLTPYLNEPKKKRDELLSAFAELAVSNSGKVYARAKGFYHSKTAFADSILCEKTEPCDKTTDDTCVNDSRVFSGKQNVFIKKEWISVPEFPETVVSTSMELGPCEADKR